MSRVRVAEVSSPISLFPFIGILLCTMGALLVVLVAVSRSARVTAERQVRVRRESAATPVDDGARQKLEQVNRYVGNLNAVRSEAERRLRDEQTRLSNIEDHIRRLHDKIGSLQSAAHELESLEHEHYDDRQQAEREINRLHQLIDDSQKTIASLREEHAKAPKSYAVVPYEGEHGTFRRPIYIECVRNEFILQPEGVRLLADDLRPPQGPGNPLATVLRAARDHLISLNPEFGKTRDTEPYPLLLVRPDAQYDRALNAIEAGDFDVGIELVESDWKLKFPQSDPQLASIEQQALEQARERQRVLAAAAPRAYRGVSMTADGGVDDGGFDGGGGGTDLVGGGDPRARGGGRTYLVPRGRRSESDEDGSDEMAASEAGGSQQSGGGTAGGRGGGGASQSGSNAIAGGGGHGSSESAGVANGGTPPGSSDGGGGSSAGSAEGSTGRPSAGATAAEKNLIPEGYDNSQSASVVARAGGPPPPHFGELDPARDQKRFKDIENRGKDWALRDKPPQSVAVRRTIRVSVRTNQLAILPDSAPSTRATNGKIIALPGDTVESIDEFVKQVRDHIDGWGIAGNGLYWRPVILLSVEPDGQRRASDLERLLKNSGLEIRTDATAQNTAQGAAHETR